MKNKKYQLYYRRPKKDLVFFSGRVRSNLGKFLDSAEVTINGETIKTDSKGYFRIAIKKKNSKFGNRYIMNIRKEGFGLLSRIYSTGIQNKTWVMTKATTKYIDPTQNNRIIDIRGTNVCQGTLSSRVDWSRYPNRRIPRFIDSAGNISENVSNTVKRAIEYAENCNTCNPGISVSISANTLVDSTGNPPEGKVLASISTVDIYDPDSMPGDYTAIQEKRKGYMVTYGAGNVELTSDKKTLQLKKGTYATLEIPINSSQLKRKKKLDSEIPFLAYNEKQGVWRVTGKAKLNEKGNAYVAKIHHFSTFNMDLVKTNQACARVESSEIDYDYFMLEVTVPDEEPRTFDVDNSAEALDATGKKLHVIYNLPSNTDIALRAFREGGILGPEPITDTFVVNTGNPQNPQDPNLPPHPYDACDAEVTLTPRSLAPELALYNPPDSSGTFTLRWEYEWTGLGSTADGYILEESSTSSFSAVTEPYNSTGNTTPDHQSPKYHSITRVPETYYYRVRAVKNGVPSPNSNVVQVVVATLGTRQLRITNLIQEGSQKLDSVLQVKIISPGALFSHSDLLTDDRDIDADTCFALPGEEIGPGRSKTFDVTIGNDYWVFIGLGNWEMVYPTACYEGEPFGKIMFFVESGTFRQYWPWIEVHVNGHNSGVWEWTITGSYTSGNLYLNPADNPSIPFYITDYNPIP